MALVYRGLNVYIPLDTLQYHHMPYQNDGDITVIDMRSWLSNVHTLKVLDKYNGKP
ncbi:MAG: hypothetical protein ACI9ES_001891 [Oceanospirillaceae bacterium]|jgi:hypothetical protein